MRSLSLLTLNIDGRRNLPNILEHLEEVRPHVACLQEVYEVDLPVLGRNFGNQVFVPMTLKDGHMIGFAVFVSHQVNILDISITQYAAARGSLRELESNTLLSRRKTERRALCVLHLELQSIPYNIGTTHFTWSKNGKPNQYQRKDITTLLALVQKYDDMVLCGDFNAPRGGEIYSLLASTLRDNIPKDCVTTLDPELHAARGVRAVVDSIFTTANYSVSRFYISYGISDHAAIKASITREL